MSSTRSVRFDGQIRGVVHFTWEESDHAKFTLVIRKIEQWNEEGSAVVEDFHEWVVAEANRPVITPVLMGLRTRTKAESGCRCGCQPPRREVASRTTYRAARLLPAGVPGSQDPYGPRLAEDNGVPLTTVHGWVREARRRDLLAREEEAK